MTKEEHLAKVLAQLDIGEELVWFLWEERQRLTAALQMIAEGDEPRPIGVRYADDGSPSKYDQCTHGRWMYEDCGNCIAEYAASVLASVDRSPEGQDAQRLDAKHESAVGSEASETPHTSPNTPKETSHD
jgi:hypothetical protein